MVVWSQLGEVLFCAVDLNDDGDVKGNVSNVKKNHLSQEVYLALVCLVDSSKDKKFNNLKYNEEVGVGNLVKFECHSN